MPSSHPKQSDTKSSQLAVCGIFSTRASMERALDALKLRGFLPGGISALLPSGELAKGVAGGVMDWLSGTGALVIPGLGPFHAAGPIMSAIAGTGIAGTEGGLTAALATFGIPEYEGKRFESILKSGGMLLVVHVSSGEKEALRKAKEIFEDFGARDITSSREERSHKRDKENSPSSSLDDGPKNKEKENHT